MVSELVKSIFRENSLTVTDGFAIFREAERTNEDLLQAARPI